MRRRRSSPSRRPARRHASCSEETNIRAGCWSGRLAAEARAAPPSTSPNSDRIAFVTTLATRTRRRTAAAWPLLRGPRPGMEACPVPSRGQRGRPVPSAYLMPSFTPPCRDAVAPYVGSDAALPIPFVNWASCSTRAGGVQPIFVLYAYLLTRFLPCLLLLFLACPTLISSSTLLYRIPLARAATVLGSGRAFELGPLYDKLACLRHGPYPPSLSAWARSCSPPPSGSVPALPTWAGSMCVNDA